MKKTRRRKGEGTVVQIGTKFRARKRIGGTDVYGPRRNTRERAERDLKNLGPAYSGKVPVLGAWAFECLQGSYGKRLAVSTFNLYETMRSARLNEHPIANMRLDMIARRHCQNFMDDQALYVLRYNPKWEKTERLAAAPSPRYLHHLAGFLHRLFALAILDGPGWIEANPAGKLDLDRIEERENRILTESQAIRLMNPTCLIEQVLKVYMLTGLRRAELTRLKWQHIGLAGTGMLWVPGTKTAHSAAHIEISESVREILVAQPERSEYVFTDENGQPLKPAWITRTFNSWKARHAFPLDMRIQDLRGSYGCMLIKQGEDLRTVLDMMRKRDAKDLIRSYLRSTPETRRSAADRMEQRLLLAAKGHAIERLGQAASAAAVDDWALVEALTTLRNMGADVVLGAKGYEVTLQAGSPALVMPAEELLARFGPREAAILKLPGVG